MKRTKRAKYPEDISASARKKILDQLNGYKKTCDPRSEEKVDWDSPVFPEPDNLLAVFCSEVENIKGSIVLAEGENDAIEKLKTLLYDKSISKPFCIDEHLYSVLSKKIELENNPESFELMKAAITRCECLVARSGSVVVSAASSGRRLNIFPPVHIVWAGISQIVPFISDAITVLKDKFGKNFPSQVSFITGPSRTADIEKTLVMGAHGPRELIIVLDKQS